MQITLTPSLSQSSTPAQRMRLFAALMALVFGFGLALVALQSAAAFDARPSGLVPAGAQNGALQPLLAPDNAPRGPLTTQIQVAAYVHSDAVRPGGRLTYTVRYTNTLGVAVANVTISDTISAGQVFTGLYQASASYPGMTYFYTGTSSTRFALHWEIPSLPANATGEIIFATTVLTTPEPNYVDPVITVGNSVQIYNTPTTVSGNSDNAVSMVVGPLLTISKTGAPTPVLPGRLVTYTLTLKNNDKFKGSTTLYRPDVIAATQVRVWDMLPSNTSFVRADTSGYYDPALNAVVWDLPSGLQPGHVITLKFTVRVTDQINTGVSIVNGKTAYGVDSAELFVPLTGGTSVTVKTAPVLVKTVVDGNGGAVVVYPLDLVTYTITVHNPLTIPLTGVLVTDTVPGLPGPFTFVRMTPGYAYPTILNNGKLLMWSVDLPALGSTSFSFVMRIPEDVYIPDNKTYLVYENALKAAHPSTYFASQTGLADVRVEAAVIMAKTVDPNEVLPGEQVLYELVVSNRSSFWVNQIRITDTLPADFTFVSMELGPNPLPAYRSNPIVWSAIDLPPQSSLTLSFWVEARGPWNVKLYNNARASSATVKIPSLVNVAYVKLLAPLGIAKTVSPNSVFLGQLVTYDLTVRNLDSVGWTVAQIEDTLATGFYHYPSMEQTVSIPVNAVIPPGGNYNTSFSAKVESVSCTGLPKAFYNAKGMIVLYITSPEVLEAVNGSNLAPVTVNPNINVTLTPYRKAVQSGNYVTYTLTLQNVSPVAANNSNFNITLPAGFEYMGSVSGPAPSPNGQQLFWSGINIAANSTVTAKFLVWIPNSVTLGNKTAVFSGEAVGVCFGKLSGGVVSVLEDVIKTSKKSPAMVAPRTVITYEISLKNNDLYLFNLREISDTLPSGFEYISMATGPQPFKVVQNGQSQIVYWQNYVLNPGTTVWKMKARAASQYGLHFNYLHTAVVNNETYVKKGQDNGVQILPIVDLKKATFAGGLAVPGMTVPYTITLVNYTNVAYSNVRITDTLPTGFRYLRMRGSSAAPISLGPDNSRPIWLIASLKANTVQTLAFDVVIQPTVEDGAYINWVYAYSASGQIPSPAQSTPITVTNNLLHHYLPLVSR